MRRRSIGETRMHRALLLAAMARAREFYGELKRTERSREPRRAENGDATRTINSEQCGKFESDRPISPFIAERLSRERERERERER
jgi:hypothetical protein